MPLPAMHVVSLMGMCMPVRHSHRISVLMRTSERSMMHRDITRRSSCQENRSLTTGKILHRTETHTHAKSLRSLEDMTLDRASRMTRMCTLLVPGNCRTQVPLIRNRVRPSRQCHTGRRIPVTLRLGKNSQLHVLNIPSRCTDRLASIHWNGSSYPGLGRTIIHTVRVKQP